MDLDSYWELGEVMGVAVSPDGGRVAVVVAEFDRGADRRRSGVFVGSADGSGGLRRLSRASDASSPAWSPDGSRLAVVAARDRDRELAVSDDTGEDGGGGRQVWVWDVEGGGDARQVTDLDGGVQAFDWGPDGDRVVAAARDPGAEREGVVAEAGGDGPVETERLQHKLAGRGWLDAVPTHLFVVDVESREATRLDDAYAAGVRGEGVGLQPAWGDGGIAFLSNRAEQPDDSLALDVFVVQPDGSGCRRVTDGSLAAHRPAWSPGGDRLAFVGFDAENMHVPGAVYVADGDGEARPVSPGLDRTVPPFEGPTWVDDGVVCAPVGVEGRTPLYRFDAGGGDPERVLDPGDDRSVRAFDAAGGTFAVVLTGPGGVDAYAGSLADLDAGVGPGNLRRLTDVCGDVVAETGEPAVEHVAWENPEGDRVAGWLYLPPDADSDDPPRPTVASVPGGPAAYEDPHFDTAVLHWTTEGYAVFRPNYRGSTSYGRAFSECVRGDWTRREVADVRSGVDALVARGVADPDRLFLTGFSVGATIAAAALAETDRFAAAAVEHGVYDLRAAFGSDDVHARWEADFGLPWEHPDAYDRASPITDVGEMDTPTLVAAGGDDHRAPLAQSEQLYVSLRKRGVPAKLVVYPDRGHGVGGPDDDVHRLRTVTEWFERFDPAEN